MRLKQFAHKTKLSNKITKIICALRATLIQVYQSFYTILCSNTNFVLRKVLFFLFFFLQSWDSFRKRSFPWSSNWIVAIAHLANVHMETIAKCTEFQTEKLFFENFWRTSEKWSVFAASARIVDYNFSFFLNLQNC